MADTCAKQNDETKCLGKDLVYFFASYYLLEHVSLFKHMP